MNAFECALACIRDSPLFFPSLLVFSGTLVSLGGYLLVRNSLEKLRFYWFANVLALINAPILALSMSCSMGLFIRAYLAYATVALLTLVTFPYAFKKYLKRNYGFERDEELERLAGLERVYVLNTSIPKAFTLGREVFVSAGMLDLLEEDELFAVLTHEKFHVLENRTPLVSRLKYLTFLPLSQDRIELMADRYAERIAGKDALERAKKKIEEFYG
ncbi:MAG: M48 family metalloprotease [Archaeoglobi archaeon]|nr:M48 family metalloprotease [Archaeoglobi archaeon]